MIPYGRQEITAADIDAVVDVLRSDWLTQGPVVPRFERRVAGYCGASHAVAASSATAALHIACLALGVVPGDVVWTSPVTFVASANCALYCGAEIDFVDIDPRTYNMCAERLAEKLAQAEPIGRLPKVVIPVHLCGQPCDMAAIHALSRRYGFAIIEDASHAIGGRYLDEPIGNCRHSDIAVFSFHPVKIVTTGEGGVATTNNEALARRMAMLRSHGITREPGEMDQPSHGSWYYQQVALGFNYRMTELQAALGLSQFDRLDSYVAERERLAVRYDRLLAGCGLQLPWQHPAGKSARHLYVVRTCSKDLAEHGRVFSALQRAGIGVNLHYIPVHLQPWYAAMGFAAGQFPEAERYYAEAISIPLYPTMGNERQDQVVAAMRAALAQGGETPGAELPAVPGTAA